MDNEQDRAIRHMIAEARAVTQTERMNQWKDFLINDHKDAMARNIINRNEDKINERMLITNDQVSIENEYETSVPSLTPFKKNASKPSFLRSGKRITGNGGGDDEDMNMITDPNMKKMIESFRFLEASVNPDMGRDMRKRSNAEYFITKLKDDSKTSTVEQKQLWELLRCMLFPNGYRDKQVYKGLRVTWTSIGSRMFLEKQFISFVEGQLGKSMEQGFEKWISKWIISVSEYKYDDKNPLSNISQLLKLLKQNSGNNQNIFVWPIIYYCMRCGMWKEAYNVSVNSLKGEFDSVTKALDLIAAAFENEVPSIGDRYPIDQLRLLFDDIVQQGKGNDNDPWQLSVIITLIKDHSLLNVSQAVSFIVKSSFEDYMWFSLTTILISLIPEPVTVIGVSVEVKAQRKLDGLAGKILELGPTYFRGDLNPYRYARLLVMCGEFEKAINFLVDYGSQLSLIDVELDAVNMMLILRSLNILHVHISQSNGGRSVKSENDYLVGNDRNQLKIIDLFRHFIEVYNPTADFMLLYWIQFIQVGEYTLGRGLSIENFDEQENKILLQIVSEVAVKMLIDVSKIGKDSQLNRLCGQIKKYIGGTGNDYFYKEIVIYAANELIQLGAFDLAFRLYESPVNVDDNIIQLTAAELTKKTYAHMIAPPIHEKRGWWLQKVKSYITFIEKQAGNGLISRTQNIVRLEDALKCQVELSDFFDLVSAATNLRNNRKSSSSSLGSKLSASTNSTKAYEELSKYDESLRRISWLLPTSANTSGSLNIVPLDQVDDCVRDLFPTVVIETMNCIKEAHHLCMELQPDDSMALKRLHEQAEIIAKYVSTIAAPQTHSFGYRGSGNLTTITSDILAKIERVVFETSRNW